MSVSVKWSEFFPAVILYVVVVAGFVSPRARSLYWRQVKIAATVVWRWRSIAIWMIGFGGGFAIIVLHPGLSDPIDRVAILTIAGMEVVALSVTFGVLGIQAQHLAETYTRAVALQAARNARWPLMLTGQALGVIFVTASAIFSPTKAAAVSATLLLAIGLAASWIVVQEFLQRFDPIHLITLQRDGAIAALARPHTGAGQTAVRRSQPVLNLIVRGADIGDTEVVAAGMHAWKDILIRYLQVETPTWSDPLLEWLFARSQELVETYAPRSAGVVLPALIEGVADLGLVCSRYVNPLNRDHDEGTHAACRVLRRAVVRSINADLSPSADLATLSVTRLGEATIEVGKIVTLQEPIRILRHTGNQTAENWPHVANRASSGLAELIIQVALQRPTENMADECARQALEGLDEMCGHPDMSLGAVHAVTAPLANNTLPRVLYALQSASRQEGNGRPRWDVVRRRWDDLSVVLANLCFGLPGRQDLYFMTRINAAECCEEILLVLLALPFRQRAVRLIADLFPLFIDLVVADVDERLHTRRLFGELLLYTYYRSSAVPQAEPVYRDLVLAAAARIGTLEVNQRRHLAPMLRRVGAAAIARRDASMAAAIARASLPPIPIRGRRAIRIPIDDFEAGGWVGETFHHHPGLPAFALDDDHLAQAARRVYLRLEAVIERQQPQVNMQPGDGN